LKGKTDSPCCLLFAGIFLGYLLNSEDGGDIFLRNVGWLSTDYMELVYAIM
jgi:hypothetical protein